MLQTLSVRTSFIFMVVLFFVAVAAGYANAFFNPGEASQLVRDILEEWQDLQQLTVLSLFFFIVVNNVLKTFVAMLSGILFGIFPLLFIFFNGYVVGIFVWAAQNTRGWAAVLASLVPHGIFELPGVFLASAYGLMLGQAFWRKLRGENAVTAVFSLSLRQYARLVLPLLLAGALVEAFITPLVIEWVRP
jgi:stage II sporulation protein M